MSNRRALTAGIKPTAKTYEGKTKNPHISYGVAGFCFLKQELSGVADIVSDMQEVLLDMANNVIQDG
ncbi:MAG: hypothetical protein WCV63_08050 [Negativicutes bacterium]